MRESDALILILIPKYRHFKRWNAIIKNMAQGMSNTYTVTHYVKTTILILKNWFWKNQIGLVISRNLIFWEREISKKIPFLRNECCINIFQNSFLEFLEFVNFWTVWNLWIWRLFWNIFHQLDKFQGLSISMEPR